MFQPVIKWSGSKRSQANEIISYFPKEINTYYEPFCGGCSVLRALLESDIKVKNYVCSDINEGLIDLWNVIKDDPVSVIQIYKELWTELNKDNDIDRKRSFFEAIRDRFNKEKNPLDFMFIMRTTTNGMPRYNRNGEFNNSFHITRNGITPDKLEKIVNEWSQLLNKYNVTFKTQSYETIRPNINDFIYLDPPYAGTKGMYFGCFDNQKLFEYLKNIKCKWAMSYAGISGKIDNTYEVPKELYDEHLYIKSGNSSFKRVIGKSNDSIVYESLYVKL
jgi:DNA adenine methylase